MFRLTLVDTNGFAGEFLRCSQRRLHSPLRDSAKGFNSCDIRLPPWPAISGEARRDRTGRYSDGCVLLWCLQCKCFPCPSLNSCSISRSPCPFDKSAVNTHDRWPAESLCMPECLARGPTQIDKLPFKREATAFLQLYKTQDMTCPFTQSQTVFVTHHRVPEVGSNELQIFCDCTYRDFSGFCILLEKLHFWRLFTFVFKHMYFLFLTLEKHSCYFCVYPNSVQTKSLIAVVVELFEIHCCVDDILEGAYLSKYTGFGVTVCFQCK